MENVVSRAQQRRYYLDWIRVLMVLLVFFVHSAMPFCSARAWAITNTKGTFVVTAWVGFCYQWGMQLFFLVAGAGAGLSLRHRSNGQYVGEKLKRLIVPYLAGMATLVPLQAYFEWVHKGLFQGSFFNFYPRYFANAHLGWDLGFGVDSSHLWFLRCLFIVSLITLPVLRWLMSENGQRLAAKMAAVVEKPGAIFLCALPIALVQMSLRPKFHEVADWSDFFCWTLFFVYGYILVADVRFEQAIIKYGKTALALGIGCFAALGGLFAAGYVEPWEITPSYSPGCVLYEGLRSVNTAAWVLFFVYASMRFLNSRSATLKYANEATLPFYILHHPAVIISAFFVVQWDAAILPKFIAICLLTFGVSAALYVLLVRRFTVLRTLFGMGPAR